MSKITPQDLLYITVIFKGSACFKSEITGINSFHDIVNHVKPSLGAYSGLATIDVRNSTEGWTARQSIFLR